MAKPAVILVGADKGGVGKTTVSRTLARLLHRPSGSDPRLRHRSAEGHAEALPSGPDRCRRHDQGAGPDEDLRHAQLGGSDRHADRRARRPDVADAAGAARYRLHRGGQEGTDHLRGVPHPRARPSPRSTRSRTPPPISATRATSWSRTSSTTARTSSSGTRRTHKTYFNRIKDAVEITIPKLNEMATEQVDLASVPYRHLHRQQEAGRRGRRRIRSCCAAMCGTGSAMSGPSTTASS